MSSSSRTRLGKLIQFVRIARVFLAKGPLYHYTYGRWRLDGWWRKKMDCFSGMDDGAFFARLELRRQGLADVEKAIAGEDYERAKSALSAYFRTRNRPKFHFEWKDREEIISFIEDEQKEATIRAADEVCRNIFRFRRVAPVKFEDGIDWIFRPGGNIDWTWDLNRHPYFITLGKAYWYTEDERYAEKFTELLLDWIAANPAGVGHPNWSSVLEVAVRLNTWIWAYCFFRQVDAFGRNEHIAFLKCLLTHARYLAARIERHAVNNHLLLEAKALAFCGILFPEFKEAREWQESGLRILWDEVEKQVCEDGVHAERAPLYHCCVMSELLEMLALLDHNGLHVPEQVIDRFERMLDFEMNITKPDGTIPLFGDSALTDFLMRFSQHGAGAVLFDRIRLAGRSLDEEMVWLLGSWAFHGKAGQTETTPSLVSRPFAQGGYFIMCAGEGARELYLAFDCGPFGYHSVPIHGHADALSFELYAYEHSLLLDSGVYSYHLGEDWRNYFRGTRAHNTVVVDGEDQSVLLGTRYVHRPAQATLHRWVTSHQFDFADGSHDGYRRLRYAITHRRQIFFVKPEYWVVIDTLTGEGRHCFDLYFHLGPGVKPFLDSATGALRVTSDGLMVSLDIVPLALPGMQARIICGQTEPIQGWVSFFSGEKLPAPTLQYRQEAVAPVQFCTVLYPHPAEGGTLVAVSPLNVETKGRLPMEGSLTGLRIETDTYIDDLVVDRGPGGTIKILAGCETDAQLVYLRHDKEDDALVQAIMRGGRKPLFQGRLPLDTDEFTIDFAPI